MQEATPKINTDILEKSESRYRNFFNTTEISFWVEDFTETKKAIDALKQQGVKDLRKYFIEHPEFVEKAIKLIKIKDVNEASVKLYEAKDKSELLGSLSNIFAEETLPTFIDELVAIAEGKSLFETAVTAQTVKGNVIHLLMSIRFPGTEDSYDNVLLSLVNITERIKAEEALKQSENRFRTLVTAIPQIIWINDVNGDLEYISQNWQNYTGQSLEEAKTRSADMIHPAEREEVFVKSAEAIAAGKEWKYEYRLLNKHTNEYCWFACSMSPMYDENGKLLRWIGSATDIDEQKKIEKQKEDFVSIASHELKTPLTSLKGYVQLLQQALSGSEDAMSLQLINRLDMQVNRMTNLVSHLLDTSRIKEGQLMLHKSALQIDQFILEKIQEIQLASKKHVLNVNLNANVSLHADAERISQVLENIISNAIKYSPDASEVLITSTVKENYVVVSVQDFGMGMTKDAQKKIFERFYRVSGLRQAGLGLGLYIASEIIRRHDGEIFVESEPGKGATFTFTLPLPA